jgi:DNA-binding MarR family transcriptional regulator
VPAPRRPQPAPDPAALARVALLTGRLVERLLAPLTVAQYLALHAAAGGELSAADLARATAVSPAAVSQLLAALEEAGLVERSRTAEDRRRQTVELTAGGRGALRDADRRARGPIAALLRGLGPRERDGLARALPELEALLAGTPPPRRKFGPP